MSRVVRQLWSNPYPQSPADSPPNLSESTRGASVSLVFARGLLVEQWVCVGSSWQSPAIARFDRRFCNNIRMLKIKLSF
ncbi:hypothetical protein DFR33_101251 [Bradymonas sediminis]|nr:hypothetical protein DFR33_101251 [Bradymonas sediminis]